MPFLWSVRVVEYEIGGGVINIGHIVQIIIILKNKMWPTSLNLIFKTLLTEVFDRMPLLNFL